MPYITTIPNHEPLRSDHGLSDSQMTRRQFVASAFAAGVMAAFPSLAQVSPSKIRLSVGAPASKPIPLDYLGFSYETSQLADPSFFAPDNHQLISLFKTLTPNGVLRIGGNSSEFCWWKAGPNDRPPELPATAHGDDNWMPHSFTAIEPLAVDHLSGFLKATDWKAIYGLNLGTETPERDAEQAAYVAKKLGSRLMYFQIGNEPEYYRESNNRLRGRDWDFDKYLAQWLIFARAIIGRVPDAKFGGPDIGSNALWVSRFTEEAPKQLPGRIVACSGHYYAEGPPDSPRTTVERLLTPDPKVERDLPRIISAANQAGLGYRMAEGNSCYRGGKPGLSNAFCSSLWAADYLLRLASYGCVGVNLHGGGATQIRAALGGHLPGEQLAPGADAIAAEGSFYTPIAGSLEHGFSARPVFYGMKFAGLLASGHMRPVQFDGTTANATAWAADLPGGGTRVILLNKDSQQKLEFAIPTARNAKLWRLQAPGLTATSGVTLAGAQIKAGKSWKPEREERLVCEKHEVLLELEPASGAAIFFESKI